ncbi:hypothetical protein CIB84_008074 [Bambusicola thoracicus]|nr:hypothetical protein CIB84_008074 [Bambusicola thoracicus]
MVYIVFS